MALLVCALTLGLAASPQTPPDPIWRPATKEELKLVNPKTRAARSKERAFFKCDFDALRAALEACPIRNSAGYKDKMKVIAFPRPDGALVGYKIYRLPTDIGMLFEGYSVESNALRLKGRWNVTFFSVTIVGPASKEHVGIEVAAPSEYHIYGSYVIPESR